MKLVRKVKGKAYAAANAIAEEMKMRTQSIMVQAGEEAVSGV